MDWNPETSKQLHYKQLHYKILGPPVPKGRPRLGKHGNIYTPPRTKEYEELVGKMALVARQAQKMKKTAGPVALSVRVYHKGKMDLANVVKSVEDGMNRVVYADDDQVVAYYNTFKERDSNQRVEVTVYYLDEPSEEA
tara:strand:- start:1154 stop:1567 length:414 start_codon:yes stop_codon:yes gene_type:complete